MALNSQKLAQDLKNAFETAKLDTSNAATTNLCNQIAQAIYDYYIQATVSTTDTGTASGGVNASTAYPSPGPITVPAVVTGTGTGTLS